MRLKTIFTLFGFFLGLISGMAQVYYPVVAKITQTPPYPVYLEDYSNGAQTFLSIQVRQNDRTIATQPFKVRVHIEGQGLYIQSNDNVLGETPFTLNYGQIYNLTPAQVSVYFKSENLKVSPQQYVQPFTEGTIRFGVQILDYLTGRPISGIQWGDPVWITANEPPAWVQPQDTCIIAPQQALPSLSPRGALPSILAAMPPRPLNTLIFQWTPRHTNVTDVEYEFSITELPTGSFKGQNVQNIFLSQPAFYTTRTTATALVYDATKPPLVEGRVYAYRVRAIAKKGLEEIGMFKNNGYSEIQSFSYGEPMQPPVAPTIVSVSRDDLRNIVTLDWIGLPRHVNYIVAYRVRGSGTDWTATTVKATTSSVQSHQLETLAREKNYELRVGSEDRYQQQAFSPPVNLDSIPYTGPPNISLLGYTHWSLFPGEDEIEDPSDIAVTSAPAQRTTASGSYSPVQSRKPHVLTGAEITLFASDSRFVTADNFDSQNIIRIRTERSNENGRFQFKNTKVLWGAEYLYLLISHPSGSFDRVVKPLLLSSDHTTLSLGSTVLTAKTHRFSPKLVIDPQWISAANPREFEEFALYRLKSVIDNHPWLINEGNPTVPAETVYNAQTYTRIADFKSTATVGGLFGNTAFNDRYLLKVKQPGRKAVYFPVNEWVPEDADGYTHFTDYYNYTPPPARISGYVIKRDNPAANAPVQLNGKTVRANASGHYIMEVGPEVAVGSELTLKALDPGYLNSYASETFRFTGDTTIDFRIGSIGFLVESQVLDHNNKPLGGVTVQHGQTSVTTDKDGWFSLVHYGDRLGSLTLKISGYEDRQVPISEFTEKILSPAATRWSYAYRVRLPDMDAISNLTDFVKNLQNPNLGDAVAYYLRHFEDFGYSCQAMYTAPAIVLERSFNIRIIAISEPETPAASLSDLLQSAEYISTNLVLDGQEIRVPAGSATVQNNRLKGSGGYAGKVKDQQFTLRVLNKSGEPLYVSKTLELTVPADIPPKDEATFLVILRPAVYFHGMVRDSTEFVSIGGSKPKPASGVTVSIADTESDTTLADGTFRRLVPLKKESVFELTKPKYNRTKAYLNTEEITKHQTAGSAREFYVIRRDTSLPVFETLMGFKAEIDKIQLNPNTRTIVSQGLVRSPADKTYFISGSIPLDGEEIADRSKIYTEGETVRLRFVNLLVQVAENGEETNAVILYKTANLVENEAVIKLFGYLPVKLSGEPYLQLQVAEDDDELGVIGGYDLSLAQKYMGGMSFESIALTDTEEGDLSSNSLRNFIPGFTSYDRDDAPEKFRMLFRQPVPKADLARQGIDSTGIYYKAPFASVGGFYSPFNVYVSQEEAEVTEEGISMKGYFTFPKIWKFRSQGPLVIKTLKINKQFNAETLTFAKSDTTRPEFAKFSVGSKWIMYIKEIQMYNNFQGYGFGGTFNMDQKNYVNIESLGFSVVNGSVYPNVVLTTPDSGFVFKNIRFTTLQGKNISFLGNAEEGTYEFKAAFKMEYAAAANSNATLKKIAEKVFPMTVNEFLWSTSGKFMIAISPGNPIEIGPIKVHIRRLIYTKGGAATKSQINDLLALTDDEIKAFYSSTAFASANGLTEGAADTLASDYAFVSQLAQRVSELDPAARWGFGFAGGVGVDNIKGMTFDSHLSFLVGDFGDGVEFELNEIFVKLESAAFYASGYIRIENSDTKVGFEGEVKVKAVSLELEAGFKFYQLYENGRKTGIELGAKLVVKANIVMGPVTWIALGGGFDLNTAEQKYSFYFHGSALCTGTPKETVYLDSIYVSVAFDAKKCGSSPVIKGGMTLVVKNDPLCTANIELDFCEVRVIVSFNCEKEYLKDVGFRVNGVFLASKNEGFFGGVNVNLTVGLLGLTTQTNALFALGGNYNTRSAFANNDARVKTYTALLPAYLKEDNGLFSGIYLKFDQSRSFSSSGDVGIANYSVGFSLKYEVTFGLMFRNGNFKITGSVAADAHLRGEIPGIVSLTGAAAARIYLEGGYNDANGWNFYASAAVQLSVYNGGGASIGCNKLEVQWVNKDTGIDYICGWCCFSWRRPFGKVQWCDLYIPVPLNWKYKICIDKGLWVSYYQRGGNAGWKYGF